ncbi:MAG: MutS family DNA mismatch repair protein, partial [Vicinamibacterales bacterium]
ERYEARAAEHAASRDAETHLSTRVARLRLATFLPGAVCLIWALARHVPVVPLVAGILLLLAFGVLVVWHARVDERGVWFDALRIVNLHALARIGRAWDRLPPAERLMSPVGDRASGSEDRGQRSMDSAPRTADLIDHHPYANDLDLCGRASLMQWLGPLATATGSQTMENWLLHPADPAAIRARQLAVIELAPAFDWRERLGAHGYLVAGVRAHELARFLEWAEGPAAFTAASMRLLRPAVLALTAAIWGLIALHAAGVAAGAFWLIPIVAGMILSFVTAGRVHGQFNRAGAGQQAFARYADLFAHATAAPSAAPYLQGVQARLSAAGSAAPDCMRRLNRILGFSQLRAGAGIFHFLIQAATLWDFHVLFALDTWREDAGPRVRGWMGALGELDALSAFAQIKADNPRWGMPSVTEAGTVFQARDLGHPLIPDDRRVGNDVTVGPPGTLLLITGSNMSGKSTLLRAIGLNSVLAQAGAPVCATALEMPPLDLETSIRVQDSLEHGLSYFMAALARLKGVVNRSQRAARAHGGRTVMYLLDEILQGTNTAERSIAVRGVARHLLNAGAIGVMTTHDLGLAAEEPLNTAARLVHFTEIVDEHGGMTFDYRLRPGIATSRNALRLMRFIGIDLDEKTASPNSSGG